MDEKVRWAQNCLRIFKLSKSVNGKESIPAQSTFHMAPIPLSHGEGGWEKKQTYPHFVGTQIEWQVVNPFCKSLRTTKARLQVGM